MAHWFTSDLHFFHENIVEYCNRPWPTLEAMHEGLILRWNTYVMPDDDVFVLGDFSFGREEWTAPICNQLHGKRYLVPGNHDRRGKAQYERLGFTLLPEQVSLTLQLPGYMPLDVLLCHFPYGTRDHAGMARYLDKRPPDDGKTWLLHGHVHNDFKLDGRNINVGVDAWDYRPVSETQIIALIRAYGPAAYLPASNPFAHRGT